MKNIVSTSVLKTKNVSSHELHELNANIVVMRNVLKLEWNYQVSFLRLSRLIIDWIREWIEGCPNPKIEEIFKSIPCAVCQDPIVWNSFRRHDMRSNKNHLFVSSKLYAFFFLSGLQRVFFVGQWKNVHLNVTNALKKTIV